MLHLERASILTVEREDPFVTQLQKELQGREIETKVVAIQGQPLETREFDSDLIALNIPNLDRQEVGGIDRFVLKNYWEKLFVGDFKSVGFLTEHLQGKTIDNYVQKQLNYRALGLASGSADIESVIQDWADTHIQQGNITLPKLVHLDFMRKEQLRYGENPHQIGGFYFLPGTRLFGIATARQLQGKQLSYNNLADTEAAFECVAEFDSNRTAAVAIVKHANPCGVAEGSSLLEAYQKALDCDPVSAFGGVVALNRPLDADSARAIVKVFTEVIIAPDATVDARGIIAKRKNVRLMLAGGVPDPRSKGLAIRSVAGGLLVQSRDNKVVDDMALEVRTKREPTPDEWRDLKFAFRVVKHVKSNAIVYAKNCATVGIGAGQMSRVDAARIAVNKAKETAKAAGRKSPIKKSVVASDAFFPFADGLEAAIQAGATAVIQPGGSIRDDEVIALANEKKVAMVFTHTRHFRH